MEFDRYNSLDANLRAQIDSMDMGGALRKSRVEKVTITKDFEVPHRICYKAVRIDASGPLSSGSRDVILTPDDSAVVVD